VEPRELFGRKVRQVREARGLSQEEVAIAANLHRTEISLLERGGRDPRLSTIVRVARALKTTPSALLNEID
jgi:transcriptional regulator with XRE-family HTH domain